MSPRRGRLPGFTLGLLILPLATFAATRPAAEIFADSCASCHGIDGKARTPMGRKAHARDLSESRLSDAEIERQIREGSKDQHRTLKTPAFADKLSADEIKALVNT